MSGGKFFQRHLRNSSELLRTRERAALTVRSKPVNPEGRISSAIQSGINYYSKVTNFHELDAGEEARAILNQFEEDQQNKSIIVVEGISKQVDDKNSGLFDNMINYINNYSDNND